MVVCGKVVRLHNGNEQPLIPLGRAVGMNKAYKSKGDVQKVIGYEGYKLKICGDIEVVLFLLGFQEGYTKHIFMPF